MEVSRVVGDFVPVRARRFIGGFWRHQSVIAGGRWRGYAGACEAVVVVGAIGGGGGAGAAPTGQAGAGGCGHDYTALGREGYGEEGEGEVVACAGGRLVPMPFSRCGMHTVGLPFLCGSLPGGGVALGGLESDNGEG